MKRTPSTDDAMVLRFAGILGHRFVVTVQGKDGKRRVAVESDSPDTDTTEYTEPRIFERMPQRRWRRVN